MVSLWEPSACGYTGGRPKFLVRLARGTVTETLTTLSHPKVTVNRCGRGLVKPRFIAFLEGLTSRAQYCCFSNTIENALSAVLERVFYHKVGDGFARPFIPTEGVVNSYLAPFLQAFQQRLTTTVPVSLSVYPEQNYWGRKLKLYQKARDNVRGRTLWEDRSKALSLEFAKLKSFVKHEKILLKDDKRLVPRLIQPRSPEYNVMVGRYIRQLEHRIYDRIETVWGGPTVMKGRNCVQQGAAINGAWMQFSNPTAIMLDAVRFDQHVSVPMLRWEHKVYLEYFRGPDQQELRRLLEMQEVNRGTVTCQDGQLKYEVQGCRASGDMNTAMGNVLIMCAAIYSMRVKLGIKMRLINNGDDCCLIVERDAVSEVLREIPSWFGTLGFIIEVEGTTNVLEEIGFCQTHPVNDGSRWVMVRDPKCAISKDATIIKNWSTREMRCYIQQLGICGYSTYGNMPIFKSFYNCLRRFGDEQYSAGMVKHVSMDIMESGLGRLSLKSAVSDTITDTARTSFAMAFGITPDVQKHLENIYDHMHPASLILCQRTRVALNF